MLYTESLENTTLPPTTNRLPDPQSAIKGINKHEANSRLDLDKICKNPADFSHIQSALAHHSRTTGHKVAWDRTTILTTTRYKRQLDLAEHAAIKTKDPKLNRTNSAPNAVNL